MLYKEIVRKVADELGLSRDIVDKTYKAYWTYIKTRIESVPMHSDLTEEEFNSYKTNFNIPSIGKIHCSYGHLQSVKKGFEKSGVKRRER